MAFVTQRLSETVRVFLGGNARVDIVEDLSLHGPVDGLQVFFDSRVVFNRPGQVFFVTRWK